MQKPLGIQKCDGQTDRPTDRPTDTARCRVACPRLKKACVYVPALKCKVLIFLLVLSLLKLPVVIGYFFGVAGIEKHYDANEQ